MPPPLPAGGRPAHAALVDDTRLFVYGTLRSGSAVPAARALHARATRIATGSVGGRLLDLGAYPGLVPSDDPAERVHGEVWTVPANGASALLRLLDTYESCTPDTAALFRRALTDVRCDNGRILRAWVYCWTGNLPAE